MHEPLDKFLPQTVCLVKLEIDVEDETDENFNRRGRVHNNIEKEVVYNRAKILGVQGDKVILPTVLAVLCSFVDLNLYLFGYYTDDVAKMFCYSFIVQYLASIVVEFHTASLYFWFLFIKLAWMECCNNYESLEWEKADWMELFANHTIPTRSATIWSRGVVLRFWGF